jgi:aldehyde dehydrogenase (NAD+)
VRDDPSGVDSAFSKCKQSFATGKTRPISYRLSQLANLKRGIKDMENDLTNAIRADLGRGEYSTWMMELMGLEK